MGIFDGLPAGRATLTGLTDEQESAAAAALSALALALGGTQPEGGGLPVTATGGTVQRTLAQRAADTVNVKDYDAKGDGTKADATALQAAFTAGAGKTVYVPAGTYLVAAPLDLPANTSLVMDPGAVLKATAAMSAVIRTPLATLSEDCGISGGALLCQGLADVGVDVRYARYFRLDNVRVEDYLVAAYHVGDTTAPGTSYEGMVTNLRCHRQSAAVPVGSIGLHLDNVTDCMVSDVVLVGAETGVKLESGGHDLVNVHPWCRASTGRLKVAFDDNGNGNVFTNCYADTPSQYGWRLRRFNTRLVGCSHYNGAEGGEDNTAITVRFDQVEPYATVVGIHCNGASAALRILRDFDFAGAYTGTALLGTQWSNVTNTTPSRMGALTTGALTATGAADLQGATTLRGALSLQATTNVPDFDGTTDSSDAATAITTKGAVVQSTDSERQVLRFRSAGTGKAGSGGVALGDFDTSDFLLHRLASGSARLDHISYVAGTSNDVLTPVMEFHSDGRIAWNGGTPIRKVLTATATWDPASIASGAFTAALVNCSGAALGDVAHASFSLDVPDGCILQARVQSGGVTRVTLLNMSGAPVDLGSGTLRVTVWKL